MHLGKGLSLAWWQCMGDEGSKQPYGARKSSLDSRECIRGRQARAPGNGLGTRGLVASSSAALGAKQGSDLSSGVLASADGACKQQGMDGVEWDGRQASRAALPCSGMARVAAHGIGGGSTAAAGGHSSPQDCCIP